MMLVDDEPFNIECLQGLMKILGMKHMGLVDICYNGEESLQLI